MNTFSIDKNNPMPLYYQLQQTIIEKINEGIYKENESIPPEQYIIKESGLSRTTVRQAIENLVTEGYLEKRRGIGTFVISRQKNMWNLEKLRSFREEFESKGSTSSTKLLSLKKIKSTKELERIFGDEIMSFYELKRLRYLNEVPVILVTTYVPEKYVKGLEQYNLSDQSLFDIMVKDYGFTIGFAEKEFRAKRVEPQDSELLNIGKHDPIQHVKTTTYSEGGFPIEYSISRDRGDLSVYKIKINKKSDE